MHLNEPWMETLQEGNPNQYHSKKTIQITSGALKTPYTTKAQSGRCG